MIGRPKFKEGDYVRFEFSGKYLSGEIFIVDAYGTFEQNEEPSYDIMINWNNEQTLFKHIRESNVEEV